MRLKWGVAAALALLASAAWSEEELAPSRSLQQFGVLTSWGGDTGFSWKNWGLSYRRFDYFDGKQTDGLYYAVVSGALLHVIDGNSLADLRVLNLGWRGNPFRLMGTSSPFPMLLDVGLSPVVELRLKKNVLALDGESVGAGGTLGAYFPLGAGDLGFSWEPVVDLKLLRWGNKNYRDSTYADFVIYWVFKSARESRAVDW
jgi:hypothetical protein